MRVLITGDSHLARPVRAGWAITPDSTSVAVGGSVATDLPGQVAGLDPAAYDVVVVSIGTNDAGWREVPLAAFTDGVSWLVGWSGTTPVVLMTHPGRAGVARARSVRGGRLPPRSGGVRPAPSGAARRRAGGRHRATGAGNRSRA
jgi:lysophospholipase L1-like esterase